MKIVPSDVVAFKSLSKVACKSIRIDSAFKCTFLPLKKQTLCLSSRGILGKIIDLCRTKIPILQIPTVASYI